MIDYGISMVLSARIQALPAYVEKWYNVPQYNYITISGMKLYSFDLMVRIFYYPLTHTMRETALSLKNAL